MNFIIECLLTGFDCIALSYPYNTYMSRAGFEPGSEQDCCLWILQSYCSITRPPLFHFPETRGSKWYNNFSAVGHHHLHLVHSSKGQTPRPLRSEGHWEREDSQQVNIFYLTPVGKTWAYFCINTLSTYISVFILIRKYEYVPVSFFKVRIKTSQYILLFWIMYAIVPWLITCKWQVKNTQAVARITRLACMSSKELGFFLIRDPSLYTRIGTYLRYHMFL